MVVLAFETKMPRRTQRHHFPPRVGDNIKSVSIVAKDPVGPDGVKAVDFNFHWAWKDPHDHAKGGGGVCMHDGSAQGAGYPFLLSKDGKSCRPMTGEELTRKVYDWPLSDVKRWRKTKDPKSDKVPTFGDMVKECKKQGVAMCAELKSKYFGLDPQCAAHIVDTCRRYDYPAWFMALYRSMPYCKEKCDNTIKAGGQFAPIFGDHQGYRELFLKNVDKWPSQPTRVW